MSHTEQDWLSRLNLPDVYHRREDVFQPGPGVTPASAPGPSLAYGQRVMGGQPIEEELGTNIYSQWVTTPGQRPTVYQRAYNISLNVGVTPVAIANQQFQADSFIINVPTTAANSIFFGYGNFVNTQSGIEIRAGLPVAISVDNNREQWEIQRILESIAAMIAAERGWNPVGTYKAPRVAFNMNEYYLVATAATAVSVMVFTVPEMQ